MASETTLSDGIVTLRLWRPTDVPAVFAACQDPLIGRFVPIPQPYSEDDARAFIEMRGHDRDGGDEQGFAIVDMATDELLGSISRHGPFGHRATFGYWLAPDARGRGVATRSLRLIVGWTLATTDAIRLDLYTDIENVRQAAWRSEPASSARAFAAPGSSTAMAARWTRCPTSWSATSSRGALVRRLS